MLRSVCAALAAVVVVAPALAQEELCPQTGVIPWLGGMVLEQRQALPVLQARRYGADAAYLTVRYSPTLSPESIEAFLVPLLEQDIRGIEDVVFAWTVVNKGPAATSELFGAEEAEALTLTSPTAVRALVASGADDVVLDAFAALNDEGASGPAGAIYTAIIDLPDARKAEIAALAEERGHFAVASAIYATMLDATAWPAFLGRIPSGLVEPISQMHAYLPLFVGNDAPPPADSGSRIWEDIHEVAAAAALQPELDLLNIYLNHTGYIDSALAAARALTKAISTGAIARDSNMDAGWLLFYREIKAAGSDPAAAIDPALDGMSIGLRPLRVTSAETLNWMLAIEALTPYLRRESEEQPPAPEGPGGTLAAEWSDWLALAEIVRNDPDNVVPDGERSLAIATELLFAAGEYQTVAAMLGSMPPSPVTVGLADDFAKRLDRLCESYLWHPAESAILAGDSIYKFDDLGKDFTRIATVEPAAPADGGKNLKN